MIYLFRFSGSLPNFLHLSGSRWGRWPLERSMAWASAHQVGPRRRKADVADVGTGKKLSRPGKWPKNVENHRKSHSKVTKHVRWNEETTLCFLMIWLIINCLFRSIQSNETKLWWGDWSSNIINGLFSLFASIYWKTQKGELKLWSCLRPDSSGVWLNNYCLL